MSTREGGRRGCGGSETDESALVSSWSAIRTGTRGARPNQRKQNGELAAYREGSKNADSAGTHGWAASTLKDLALGNFRNPGHISSVGRPNNLKICRFSGGPSLESQLIVATTLNEQGRQTLLTWSISPRPGRSGSRRMSSPKMQPMDQMSTAVEYSVAPNKSSGALGFPGFQGESSFLFERGVAKTGGY